MAPVRCKPHLQPAMRARSPADTDWPRIAALYDRLRAVMPSPVVDLNRAVAHSMAFGPEAGLRLIDEIADDAALRNYAPLPAARGDFLFRAGRLAEARSEFEAGPSSPATCGKLLLDPDDIRDKLGRYGGRDADRVYASARPRDEAALPVARHRDSLARQSVLVIGR
jgi:hypothetical protein